MSIEFEFQEGPRPADCVCPQSGTSRDCKHHGQALAETGWDEDGKLVHTPLKWDRHTGGWTYDAEREG